MYLIKHKGVRKNAKRLKTNDVISINKKWYVIREELGLEDTLKLSGLRDGKKYTVEAIVSFGAVDDFLKVGKIIESKFIEEINIDSVGIKKKINKMSKSEKVKS